MSNIRVVKIKEDGSVKAKVTEDDIISDGKAFYKIFLDRSTKRAVLIDFTLGEFAKLLDINIPSIMSNIKIEVGKEYKYNNKVYKIVNVKNKIGIDIIENDDFDFIIRRIDNVYTY